MSNENEDVWQRAGRSWRSRLIVGTGKYKDAEETRACLAASGAEIVTVALRRVDLSAKDNLLSWIDRDRYTLLPNTAGCYTAEDAIRTAMDEGTLIACDIVWAELAGAFPSKETLERAMRSIGASFNTVTLDAAFTAGAAWRAYRRAGGRRTRAISDFIIGAHALTAADRLPTRDRGFSNATARSSLSCSPEAA